jgi:hypothetical protein
MKTATLVSAVTCPACQRTVTETMPTTQCVFFWECPACHAIVKPKPGDCCVYCSYGDTPCPSIQAGRGGCSA